MSRSVAALYVRVRGALTALVLFAIFLVAAPAAAAPCATSAACRTSMAFEGLRLTLYASAPLDRPQPDIRRAVVVIHGTDGNADDYFRAMTKAAALAGQASRTLVIAPRFVAQGDGHSIGARDVFWNRGADWRAGDLSSRDTPPRLSSFDIMSRIVARLADEQVFPNLSAIVLAGHSAGGQFVQRYAIGQPEDPARDRLPVTYVVANPSSYLYLDARRPDPRQPGAFAVPPGSACLPNRFKYGFEQPNSYFKARPVAAMTARYRARRVVYLLGAADIDPNAKSLSRSCAAMAQGDTRFARGTFFMAYMDGFYAPHAHGLVAVPGVGHSARGMFQSPAGLAVLFP